MLKNETKWRRFFLKYPTEPLCYFPDVYCFKLNLNDLLKYIWESSSIFLLQNLQFEINWYEIYPSPTGYFRKNL